MQLADLLRERLDVEIRYLGEQTHADTRALFRGSTSLNGLSLREVEAVLDWLGVDRCHQAIRHWKEILARTQSDPPTSEPSRVAVDEKQIEIDGEEKWLYAAIDTELKLLLEVDVFSRRGAYPAAASLHRLTENMISLWQGFSSTLVAI